MKFSIPFDNGFCSSPLNDVDASIFAFCLYIYLWLIQLPGYGGVWCRHPEWVYSFFYDLMGMQQAQCFFRVDSLILHFFGNSKFYSQKVKENRSRENNEHKQKS